MFNRVYKIFFITILFAAFSCTNKSAREIPIADFFNIPAKSAFRISPDGHYISYIKNYNGKQNIFIKSLIDGKERMAPVFDYSVRDYFWTYNNQIIVTPRKEELNQFQMFAIDVATLQIRNLLSIEKVNFKLLNRNRNNPDVITFTMNKRDSMVNDVYHLDTKTGELKMYLKNPGNITMWYPDVDGKIRLAKTSDDVNETILFRENEKAEFKPIIRNNFKNRVDPVAFTGVKNYFYALSNVNRDKMALVEINAENGKEEKVVYGNENADIDDVYYSKTKRRAETVSWQCAKPQRYFLNPDVKALYDDLYHKLSGNEIKIIDRDSSENNNLIYAYSDRNRGEIYLYQIKSKQLTKLGDLNGGIKPSDLCEMKPVSFKAGDGMVINGYLTIPLNTKAENLPVVVIPHNDPWRRNTWGYSDEVQFLTNRGYAVFQVNYRGSTGYGKAFYSAGFKQIGGKMQQDITDGVKWLISEKIADPKRIAIFGSWFGGFSALYGMAFHPELYKCAAIQYGMINSFTLVKDVPPDLKPYLSMIYEKVGNPETDADQFRAISPVFNTKKFKAPILIYQSSRDPHANISELNQFVRELRKRKVPVTYILKGSEHRREHIPPWERNKLQMYTELERFLSINLLGNK